MTMTHAWCSDLYGLNYGSGVGLVVSRQRRPDHAHASPQTQTGFLFDLGPKKPGEAAAGAQCVRHDVCM